MLVWVGGLLAIIAFSAAFMVSGLVRVARAAVDTSQQTVAVLRDSSLDDDTKEAAAQAGAGKLLLRFVELALRSALVLAVPVLVIYAFQLAGLATADAIFAFLLQWQLIVATLVLAVVIAWLRR